MTGPCTLFELADQPAAGLGRLPAELGVRFRSELDGYVSGVRFYKTAANTGRHPGTLWSADGQRLTAGTFADETPSGWQTLEFATAVPVRAGQTYVASFFAPHGHYCAEPDFFYYRDYPAWPLVAEVTSADRGTGNGVRAAGAGFPGWGGRRDQLLRRCRIQLLAGRSRPDLLGLSASGPARRAHAAGRARPAMVIGLLSDAHGNPLGLRSCLAALRAAGAGQVYFLGEAVGYLPGEAEVIESSGPRRHLPARQSRGHAARRPGPRPWARSRLRPGRGPGADAARGQRGPGRLAGRAGSRARGPAAPAGARLASGLSQRVRLSRQRPRLGRRARLRRGVHGQHPPAFAARRGQVLVANVGSSACRATRATWPRARSTTPAAHDCQVLRVPMDAAGVTGQFAEPLSDLVAECLARRSRRAVR